MNSLPKWILIEIFKFLDTKNLIKLESVCKFFKSIIRSNKWNLYVFATDFIIENYKFQKLAVSYINKNIDCIELTVYNMVINTEVLDKIKCKKLFLYNCFLSKDCFSNRIFNKLELYGCDITNNYKYFQAKTINLVLCNFIINTVKNCEKMEISATEIKSNEMLIIVNNPNLKSLKIRAGINAMKTPSDNNVKNICNYSFPSFDIFKNLQKLDLTAQQISDNECQHLMNIPYLNLSGTLISGSCFKNLEKPGIMIDVSRTKFEDVYIEYLRYKKIILSYTPIESIENIYNKLEYLDISYTYVKSINNLKDFNINRLYISGLSINISVVKYLKLVYFDASYAKIDISDLPPIHTVCLTWFNYEMLKNLRSNVIKLYSANISSIIPYLQFYDTIYLFECYITPEQNYILKNKCHDLYLQFLDKN